MKVNLTNIIKECFWDYNISEDEIKEIISSDNYLKKKFLFQKILESSSNIFRDLTIFKIDELEKLLNDYSVPKFNYDFFFRRKNIAEYYFLGKELLIDELKWEK
jgi:hypothetical protein